MNVVRSLASLAAVASLVAACSASPDPEPAPRQATEALTPGCRMVCPQCHPNEICPLTACYEDCNGKPASCVDTMLCPIGYTWSQSACSCVP